MISLEDHIRAQLKAYIDNPPRDLYQMARLRAFNEMARAANIPEVEYQY